MGYNTSRYRLGDLCEFYRGASVPRTRMHDSGDCLYIHYGDLYKGFSYCIDAERQQKPIPYILSSEKIKDEQRLLDQDIVYVLTSETVDDLGHSFLFNNPQHVPAVAGTETTIVRVKDHCILLPAYLNYLMHSPRFLKMLRQYVRGMKVFRVHPRDVARIEIELPAIETQRKTVLMLDAIHEKLLVNVRTNGYLAEIAEGIFEDWLHTAGGDSVPLSRIASFNPSTYATKEKWPTVVYIDTGSVTRNHFEDPVVINTAIEKLPSRARRKVENGDVLYSTVRPNQLHYGLMNNPPSNLLVSTGFTVVRDKAGVGGPFIYLALTRPSITEMLQSVAEQSTSAYPSIKSSDLGQIEIPEPTKEELGKIKPQLDNLFELIAQNERESRALRELRDALLPKLMSGEIDVSQIGLPTQPNSHLREC